LEKNSMKPSEWGEAEDVRADHDPEQQLDDDDRRRQPLRHDGDSHRGDGRDHDYREEGAGVDIDQGGAILRRQGRLGNGPC
jgi:hypothetical protein